MAAEPPVKRTIAFVDGQNLFHAVKSAFGYTYPNYNVKALAQSICAARGWQLDQVRFYTGVPDSADNAMWNRFWAAEVRVISKEQTRWIKMASAFPVSPAARNKRGINSTDWVPIDRAAYDACIDPRDYRPKP